MFHHQEDFDTGLELEAQTQIFSRIKVVIKKTSNTATLGGVAE